jgi:integrase
MALSDTFARQVKHSGAAAGDKHTDGDGLYLLVKAAGKYWRMNYRFGGKYKTMAIGVYPQVSLVAARRARDEARLLLAAGTDPSAAKQEQKNASVRAAAVTFESVARDWLKVSGKKRGELTQGRVESWFEREVFPAIGALPIDKVRPKSVLEMLRRMEARGIVDSMHRVRGYCSQVFEFAMVAELVDRDPTIGMDAALEQRTESHYAALTDPQQLGALLRAIAGYTGHPACTYALRIAPYVFVRPGELRTAEWSEIDLEAAEWCIPAAKMKMKIDHIVPLARQVVALFEELKQQTGHARYAFPSIRSTSRPMSDNTVNAALRQLGYTGDVLVGHGFRATARTLLDEDLGERVDLIEHQLAHAVKDVNGRAYNRTTHLEARRGMMQRWADYLDRLREGAKIIPLQHGQ